MVVADHNLPTILCGDFNLMPDTKSIEILETGMQNLVKNYNVTSTRSSFYKNPSVLEIICLCLKICRYKVSKFSQMKFQIIYRYMLSAALLRKSVLSFDALSF